MCFVFYILLLLTSLFLKKKKSTRILHNHVFSIKDFLLNDN